jgi:hypothetical protein
MPAYIQRAFLLLLVSYHYVNQQNLLDIQFNGSDGGNEGPVITNRWSLGSE